MNFPNGFLVKMKGMGLTVDCFGHINSELTFLGTFIPNPVKMVGKQYDKALLARAIGHIK